MLTAVVIVLRRALVLFLLPWVAASPTALGAGDQTDPDWPCKQPKTPAISIDLVWAGPEVHENSRAWKESTGIAALARTISVRRLPIEEAEAEIDRFAETLGEDNDAQMALLFSGVLQIVNTERTEIMAGIERYARRQAALAERIKAAVTELNALRAKSDRSEAEQAEIAEVEERLLWDTRIFDERQRSLSYVCESPVLLEQRLSALSRHIMSRLN